MTAETDRKNQESSYNQEDTYKRVVVRLNRQNAHSVGIQADTRLNIPQEKLNSLFQNYYDGLKRITDELTIDLANEVTTFKSHGVRRSSKEKADIEKQRNLNEKKATLKKYKVVLGVFEGYGLGTIRTVVSDGDGTENYEVIGFKVELPKKSKAKR